MRRINDAPQFTLDNTSAPCTGADGDAARLTEFGLLSVTSKWRFRDVSLFIASVTHFCADDFFRRADDFLCRANHLEQRADASLTSADHFVRRADDFVTSADGFVRRADGLR